MQQLLLLLPLAAHPLQAGVHLLRRGVPLVAQQCFISTLPFTMEEIPPAHVYADL